jgi:hypothetical protein
VRGQSAVPEYRLYFHDKDGHFIRREDLDLPDDDAALRAARELDHAYCIEAWQEARKVGIVKPDEASLTR